MPAPGALPIDPDSEGPDTAGPVPGRPDDLAGDPAGNAGAPGRGAGPAPGRRWDLVAVVGAGGAVGGAARLGVNLVWPNRPGLFPWATFLENIAGCLLIGALMVYLLEVLTPHRYARPFLGAGVLGGFTTFSAYTADTAALLRAGRPGLAAGYLFGTLLLAVAATWVGLTMARQLATRTHSGGRGRAGAP